MNYELAKELKEAGFPQHGGSIDIHCHDGHEEGCTNEVCCPTLSELIEACGDKFRVLRMISFKKEWRAEPNTKFLTGSFMYDFRQNTTGSTPEEAVARLWLALNTKEGDK